MKSRAEIIELLKQNHELMKDSFGVREIGVFGSVVRGQETEGSDIDILVELENETFDAYMGLLFFLEGIFGTKVDLVMKTGVRPAVRENILAETVYV